MRLPRLTRPRRTSQFERNMGLYPVNPPSWWEDRELTPLAWCLLGGLYLVLLAVSWTYP